MEKEKLWTKDFISITSINFFLMLTFYLLMVTISVFASEHFGANESTSGLASSIFVIGALFGRILGGKYINSFGRKKILLLGIFIMIISSIIYFIPGGLSLLMANRVLHGFGFGIAGTATGTIVAQVIPSSRNGEGIGYFALSMTLATAIGPFIGIFILENFHFNAIFVFCLICIVISLILSILIHVQEIKLTPDQLAEMNGFKLSNFIERKSVPITLIATVTAFCYSGVLSFLTFYAKENHVTEAAAYFFVVYAAAILVSRPFTGRQFDLKGPNFVMYPAIICLLLGLFILSQSETGLVLLVAGALLGIGYGTYMSSAQAVAISVAPPHRVGLATSTFFILTDIGLGIGPFIQGLFIPSVGYNGLYVILGICAILCLPLQHFLYGKNTPKKEKY
ncbi:MFS transporter [Rummeliibacillus sp. TYF005]|uniref:MFS transporter n=1 Tax=Rummeliibacillus sp. TYF005 TaxID=2058214 RepID=UPI000F51FBA5|nr:MFS transporter [Rummeliibacillus sp. TYF005]RPJ94438.1 MFS transporter [Rummeliibacillus sp. TYF005]